MCAHKHYKYDKDGRTAPGVRGHGSLTLSHSGNVVTRIGLQQQRSRVDRAAWLWSSKSRKVVSLRLRHPMTVKPALNGYFFLNRGIFHLLCPIYSGSLTPSGPTATDNGDVGESVSPV